MIRRALLAAASPDAKSELNSQVCNEACDGTLTGVLLLLLCLPGLWSLGRLGIWSGSACAALGLQIQGSKLPGFHRMVKPAPLIPGIFPPLKAGSAAKGLHASL